jgi:hypothetical protein
VDLRAGGYLHEDQRRQPHPERILITQTAAAILLFAQWWDNADGFPRPVPSGGWDFIL